MLYAKGDSIPNYSDDNKSNFTMQYYVLVDTNLFILQDNSDASTWISSNSLISISKSDAQTLVNAKVSQSQGEYDAMSTDDKLIRRGNFRHPGLTLP
jgi:hypothetical protein